MDGRYGREQKGKAKPLVDDVESYPLTVKWMFDQWYPTTSDNSQHVITRRFTEMGSDPVARLLGP